MDLLLKIFVCFLAGAGAGIGTGFAGMSAAAVIGPMLVAFLGVPAYEAVGMGYHFLDVANVPPNILKVPTNHHPRFSRCVGSLFGVCQIFFPCLLAVGSRLLRKCIPYGRV